MDRATKFILIALLTFTLFAGAQTASAPPSREAGTSSVAASVNPAPSAFIRILTPTASQKLGDHTAIVRFELANPASVPGAPAFLVKMDGKDPVTTSQTEQVFTGLSVGAHTVTVELVDAHGAPIHGGYAAVQFYVAPPPAQTAVKTPGETPSAAGTKRELKIAGLTFQRPDPAMLNQDESNLPPASSPLPLISIIGFGVLVGGIVSAMKTRS